jgi:Uncharacterized conserved protein
MIGLKRGSVLLSPHNEEWHMLFEEEKSRVLDSIGEYIVAVEHVGSTAICGISAKPIIDIAVAIRTFDEGTKCVAGLERLDYEYKGENGVPERHFFGKGIPRTHHLHMVAIDSDFWSSHLVFRDYLNEHHLVALEYNRLKQNLAGRFPENREAYTDGKALFVKSVLRRAGSDTSAGKRDKESRRTERQ